MCRPKPFTLLIPLLEALALAAVAVALGALMRMEPWRLAVGACFVAACALRLGRRRATRGAEQPAPARPPEVHIVKPAGYLHEVAAGRLTGCGSEAARPAPKAVQAPMSLAPDAVLEALGWDGPPDAADPGFDPMADPATDDIERCLSARLSGATGPFAVVLIRLDQMDAEGRPHGLDAGCPMLAEAAAVIRGCLRPEDRLQCRADSGFGILLGDAPGEAPVRVGSRITIALERMAEHTGVDLAASAGYGVYPNDGRTARALMFTASRRLRMDRGARLSVLP